MAGDMKKKKIRVLVGKVGLDGHTVGAKVVARGLRDAGMEVIYTGIRNTPEMIVNAAIQEDVDVMGISILSGAHMYFFEIILNLLRKHRAENIVVVGGGVIPSTHIEELKRMGVREIFLAGTPVSEIVEFIRKAAAEKEAAPEKSPL